MNIEEQILNLKNRVKRFESLIEGRENADGCQGCRYEIKEPWEEPCKICRKNYMDRWEKA